MLGVYGLGAWLVFWPLPLWSRTRVISCACSDPAQQVWFLALGRAQVAAGHLSLFTRLVDYPTGANLLANTSMPLLAWVSSPLTALVGPVGSYDLLCRLALFLSATACFFALRHVGVAGAGAALGGLLYGFSPYMYEQGGLHLFIMFVPLPPLILMLVYRQLDRGGGPIPTLRRGVLIGLMVLAQFLISSEVLVTLCFMTGVLLFVGLVGAAVRRVPDELATAAARAAGLGAVVAVVAGPPLLAAAAYALDGPEALDGPTKLLTVGVHWSSILLPVDRSVLMGRLISLHSTPIRFYGDVAFLGAPVVAIAVVAAVVYRRRVLVQAAAALLVVAWLLSLGPGWGYRDRYTVAVDWAPLRLVWRLPVLQDIMPNRLALYTDLAAAVLVGVAVEGLVRRRAPEAAPAGPSPWPARLRAAGVIAVVGSLALMSPWLPAAKTYSTVTDVAAARLLRDTPDGTTVLAYPYPEYVSDQPMLWQAIDGMRFRLLGGYLLQPGPEGQTEAAPPPLDPNTIPAYFEAAQFRTRPITRSFFCRARRQLPILIRRDDISVIIVDTAGFSYGKLEFPSGRAAAVIKLVTAVLGPPRRDGTFEVWDVSRRERTGASARAAL